METEEDPLPQRQRKEEAGKPEDRPLATKINDGGGHMETETEELCDQ